MTTLRVSEIFYSLQGEGVRKGEPSLFVRLQGCSAKHACYVYGVRCDTEFESGAEMDLDTLRDKLMALSNTCFWIVFTGGEPLDQLTSEVLRYFRNLNYMFQIETSGTKYLPPGLGPTDLITISPKVAEHVLEKNFPEYVRGPRSITLPKLELKYVRHKGQTIPAPALQANHLFLSPHFDGLQYSEENIKHCIQLCLDNPQWGLSIQEHKLVNIL